MADMRLMVAGAGGRMGRTLIKAIADSKGRRLPARWKTPRSPLIGKDAGVLAGLPENGVKLAGDAGPLSANADGIMDFTVPAATHRLCRDRGQGRQGAHHRHHRPVARPTRP